MKLNLLPTHVSKASAARTATILSGLMAAAMVAAAVWMSASSKKELDDLHRTMLLVQKRLQESTEKPSPSGV